MSMNIVEKVFKVRIYYLYSITHHMRLKSESVLYRIIDIVHLVK